MGRFALEARNATLNEVRAAADALVILPTDTKDAMSDLQRLWARHRFG
jgi:hypothetical protein